MESTESDTVELIRICAQTYWLLRNYAIDSRNGNNIKSADFDQSIYGPDKKEWPGSPVGFSWDVEFIFKNNNEEYFTLDALYESEWIVSAERSKPGTNGPETVEAIFENCTNSTSECISLIKDGTQKLIKYCNERKSKNA